MEDALISPCNSSRRGFLKSAGLIGLTAAIATQPVFSAVANAAMPSPRVTAGGENRDISLYNPRTGEKIHTVFFAHGQYDKRNFNHLCHFLRDCRSNTAHWMDPKLLTMLHDMQRIFDNRQIHVISGYRSPYTNEMLRHTSGGVAKNSYHMYGRAIDLRIPGIETRAIRDVAKTLGVGGVGYYPASQFVHVDTGPIRTW